MMACSSWQMSHWLPSACGLSATRSCFCASLFALCTLQVWHSFWLKGTTLMTFHEHEGQEVRSDVPALPLHWGTLPSMTPYLDEHHANRS